MKRGFLNSQRYKRAIGDNETNAKPSSPPQRAHNEDDIAIHDQDVMDVSGDSGDGIAPAPITREADSNGKDGKEAINADNRGMNTSPDGADLEKAEDQDLDDLEAFIDKGDNTSLPITSEPTYICRIPPRRPGWGRDPDENILHTVPVSHGSPLRKRHIFRHWPRRPNGQPITLRDGPKGKMSPDGYPWGATLYDLFTVFRAPPCNIIVSYMTGSALLEEMRALGELDAAAPEIEWAKSEGEPRDEGAADTEELILSNELGVRVASSWGGSVVNLGEPAGGEEEEDRKDEEGVEGVKSKQDEKDAVDQASISPPPIIPVTSPFHPSHYPKPWPFPPFSKSALPILLQDRIPSYLLPQTLHVHDPFNLLSARDQWFDNKKWNSRPDIVRTYNLSLTASVCEESAEARKKAKEVEEFKARTLIILKYERTNEQVKNYEPMVEVPLPPYPRRLTRVEEAHLYISPIARVGEGHHSIVYKGELELPRDLFVRPTICRQCFKESVDKEVQRLKDTGRWQKMLTAGPKGYTGREPSQEELAAVSDPVNLEQNGEIIEREIICIVPPNAPPFQILTLLDDKKIWDVFMEKREQNSATVDFANVLGEEESMETVGSTVATIRIDPPFSYDDQKNCTHRIRFGDGPAPRTARFTVIAKLSLEHDLHLAREAVNYQQFPEHFFRHYNGYTIIPQLRGVVPVHAIIPQFYGYYKPLEGGKDMSYLSPILLLEHCGKPIDPEELSSEDQEECASMLLRFQRAGWLHESVFPRNFVVQAGRPTEFPLQRRAFPELSFRLIDFGRSRKYAYAYEKQNEERMALAMLQKIFGRMSLTLY